MTIIIIRKSNNSDSDFDLKGPKTGVGDIMLQLTYII